MMFNYYYNEIDLQKIGLLFLAFLLSFFPVSVYSVLLSPTSSLLCLEGSYQSAVSYLLAHKYVFVCHLCVFVWGQPLCCFLY